MSLPLPRLLAITDRARFDDPVSIAAALAARLPGRIAVQLRERDLQGRALVEMARALIARCRPRGCPVLINDRVDIALAAGADGVQLPESGLAIERARALLGSGAIIAASRHDCAGVTLAAEAGADLIVYGPVWPTRSKPGHRGVGLQGLREACRAAGSTPVLALGGICGSESAVRTKAALAAGAYGVAAIRGMARPADAAEIAAAAYGDVR